ncbi:MAG: tetratricopeptide repeat protein [Prevotella sp.]|nr:tetratricopeptide repeat protein [Candidatus Prevotella equi]
MTHTKYFISLFVFVFVFVQNVSAQKDPDAVQSAMAQLIHHQSTNADTIAVELSKRFKKSAPMQVALARAYYRNNERSKTRYYLAKAMQADDKYSPAYILYGDMYGEWDIDSACYWFDKAIEAKPRDPDGYVRYANVMSRRDMDKAKEKLEELRKVLPSYNVDVEIASLYNKKGDDKSAAEAMAGVDLRSLSMNQTAQYLQNCYWANNDERGIEVAKFAVKRFPQNRGFNRVYSWCAARSGSYKEAIEQGDKWFKNTPVDSINSIDLLTMGSAYLGEGNYDKAFSYWERIKFLKNDYFAPQMRGQINRLVNARVDALKGNGEYDNAADLYRRFVKEYPSETDPAYQLYSLSQIHRDEQEELNGAEKLAAIKKMFAVYTELEDRYPRWENLHFVLYTHARWQYAYFDPQNEEQLAEPYYQKLYDFLQTKNELNDQQKAMAVEACQYMASTEYFQRQNVTKARQWWTRILTFDPDNQSAKDALAKIKK